jgi:hypothetical protein
MDGWEYIEILKGMSAETQTVDQSATTEAFVASWILPCTLHTRLVTRKTRPVTLLLSVDYFEVKYVGEENAHHLGNALIRECETTSNWGGTLHSSLTLKWDYKKCTCGISMPGYVSNILSKFQHPSPKQPIHSPSKYAKPLYGANNQYAARDETPPLNAEQCINIQYISGSILYYCTSCGPNGSNAFE